MLLKMFKNNSLLRRLSGFRRRRENLRLAANDDEVSLLANDKEAWRFPWNEVERIETYKQDLFSVDLICLDFVVESRKLTYHTHEDMQGFRDLWESMCRRFPSIDEHWLPQVASPPFATNRKVLYQRRPANEHNQI
jgi:hypothetical protein